MTDTSVMDEINASCLEVWRRLAEVPEKLGAPAHDNLATVFFFHLQSVLSSWVYRQIEVRTGLERPDLAAVRRQAFPFVDYFDVREPIDPASKTPGFWYSSDWPTAELNRPRIGKPLQWALRMAGLGGRRVGFMGPSLSLRRLAPALLRRRMAPVFVETRGFPRDLADAQMPTLLSALGAILAEFGATQAQQEGLAEVIRRSIHVHCAEHERPYEVDVLVVGTMAHSDQRTSAAAARRSSIPVIGITHGESHGVHDEPYFGYVEHTLVTHVLVYGPEAAAAMRGGEYLKPVQGDFPSLICSDGPTVRQLYDRAGQISEWPRDKSARLVYVPTAMSGFEAYGPYRSMPDAAYAQWQLQVLDLFPNAAIKLNRTDPGTHLQGHVDAGRILGGDLVPELSRADGVIFDFISTAFTFAAATDKPILFLDHGLRNLSAAGRAAIEARCVTVPWSQARRDDLAACIDRATARTDFKNTYSELFCLDPAGRSRVDALIQAISDVK